MTEFTDIQTIWQALHQDTQGGKPEADLTAMLHRRSRRVQAELIRSLRREASWLGISGLPLLYAAYNWQAYGEFLWIGLVLFGPVVGYQVWQTRQLHRLDMGQADVLQTLYSVQNWLTDYLRRMRWVTLVGMPLFGAIGILTGIGLQVGWDTLWAFEAKYWLIIGGCMLIYALLCIMLGTWYVERQYGAQLEVIETCIKELSPAISASSA